MIKTLRAFGHFFGGWFWRLKRSVKFLLSIAFILVGALFFLRTPDSDLQTMIAKYGGPNVRFTQGVPNGPHGSVLNVRYRDQGNPDGEPIIFIHGSSASLHTWEGVVAALGDRYRLISYDQPGHGLTGPHPDDDYSAQGMFEALDAVMKALGVRKAVLVGNSMGGWVSWRYALDYPSRVKALVLIDAAGAPSADVPPLNLGFRLIQNPITRPLSRFITPRALVKKSIEQTVGDPRKVDDKTVDLYWELLRVPGNRRATILRALTPRQTEKYGNSLGEITAPTLILWGEKDRLIYASSADIFDAHIPDSRKIIYPGIGHIPMEETPQRVAQDIDAFLSSLSD